MRNLKRALSLALASVMLLGMMVVGTSAASYTDVDENDNVEAIEVLNAIDVMIGRQGNFEPDEPVNRHEMAVIMAKLVLGVETADNYVGTHPFTDVVPWADKYVAACYENGLVAGTSATTFGGSQPLTAVQAAAMMLRALGYEDLSKGASDWRAPVTSRANLLRLFNGVASNPNEKLNRNQVAQLALNTLKSPMVNTIDGTFDVTSGQGGVVISGGARTYETIVSGDAYATAISDVEAGSNAATSLSGYAVELGEQLYNGDLRLDNDATDVFGRPARQWEYDGKEIGTYVKKELLRQEWTEKVTGKMLYELLSKNTIDTYDFVITIDGETEEKILAPEGGKDYGYFTKGNLVRTNTEAVGNTGKGVLTQVYVDNNSEDPTVYISIINTYLAKAVDDYNERKDEASFTVWSVDDPNKALVKDTGVHDVILDVKGEDFDIKDVKDGDIVLVRVAENEIKEIIDPEILSDLTINSFSKKDWVNVGGAKYDYANTAQYDTDALYQYSNSNLKELTYNVVLDMYGYLIGIEQNEDPDQYVFITGNDGGNSDLRDKEADMAAIFLDGTMKVIKVNVKDSTGNLNGGAIINRWFTYTVNSSDVYTLNAISTTYSADGVGQWAQNVEDAANVSAYANANSTTPNWTYSIDKAHVSLVASSNGLASDRRVYGNDDTVYINVSTDVINAKTNYNDEAVSGTSTTTTGNGYTTAATVTGAADTAGNYYLSNGGATAGTVNTKLAVIIDDVDSVTTGVKNASLVVKDVKATDYVKTGSTYYAANEVAVPKSEIYTLYDGGDVIAAITIGEDQGATSHYVYVHSDDVSFEEFGHSSAKTPEGKWLWEREVIMDGKITTLTEISDGAYAKIDTAHMDQGKWYKISFDADGNVRKVEGTSAWPTNRYGDDVQNVEDYYDANQDLVIVEVNYTGAANGLDASSKGHLAGGLVFTNGTLYTDYANRKGFSVSTNVNVVYANAKLNRGVKEPTGNFTDVSWFDETVDGYTNYSGLERALRLIDSRDAAYFCGVLSAVVEDGIATSIIINDTFGEYIDQGGSTEPVVGKYSSVVDQDITTNLDKLDMSDKTGTNISFAAGTDAGGDPVTVMSLNVWGGGDPATQIKDALTIQGYTIVGSIKKAGDVYTITAAKNGVDETIQCDWSSDATKYWIVNVDGTKSYEVAGNVAVANPNKGANDGLGFIATDKTGTAYADYGDYTVADNKGDVVIKTGYVSVATPSASGAVSTKVQGSNVTVTAPTYVKDGEAFTVSVTIAADGNVAAATTATWTVTGGTATGAPTSITEDQGKNGTTLTFTVTNTAETKVTALSVALS